MGEFDNTLSDETRAQLPSVDMDGVERAVRLAASLKAIGIADSDNPFMQAPGVTKAAVDAEFRFLVESRESKTSAVPADRFVRGNASDGTSQIGGDETYSTSGMRASFLFADDTTSENQEQTVNPLMQLLLWILAILGFDQEATSELREVKHPKEWTKAEIDNDGDAYAAACKAHGVTGVTGFQQQPQCH